MKKYISVIAVLFAVGIAGCKKDYLSQEKNPNQPSVNTPDLALSSTLVSDANVLQGSYPEFGVWGGYWTTSGNYVPNQALNEYQLTTNNYTGVWDQLYLNLSNWNTLQGLAKTSGSGNYQAIAMIMKAFDFEQLVDNFNNVPYSQAFDSKNLTPAYDKGSDIYIDLGKQLDAAIVLINSSTAGLAPSTADVMFGGDMTQWKKFANTIKLRLAIHTSSNPGSSAAFAALKASMAAHNGEGYLDADAVVQPGFTGANATSGASQESPFYGVYGFDVTGNATFGYQYYRANAYAVKFYLDNNDPRAAAFYAPTDVGGIIQGNIFGDILHNNQNPATSAIGTGLLAAPTQPAILFSGAEAAFLQAEAIQNGIITVPPGATYATAQAAYEGGITLSFESLGLTDAQAATYYGQAINNVGWASSTNKQQAILVQKWASLNGLFNLEAYNEYRRTGIPALPSSVDPAALGTTLPTRILYPASELSTNAGQLGKEGTISPLTSKIFWAK